MKKKRFNIIYNNDESIGFGKGYYIVFENHEGKPTLDCRYGTIEYNKDVDMVSVGILNKINYLYDMGYVLDTYYKVNLKDLF